MTYRAITNKMYGGVSRQAADLRHTKQCQEAINCLLTIRNGYDKRAGSHFIPGQTWSSSWSNTAGGELDVTAPTGVKHYHWYSRDDDESYVMIFGNNGATSLLDVFNIEGQKQLRQAFSASELAYQGADASLLRTLSNADATYLLNTAKEVVALTTLKQWDLSTSDAYSEASELYSIRDDRFIWTESVAQSGEFHLAMADGSNPFIISKTGAPTYSDVLVYLDRVGLTSGSVGSLAELQFDVGDNDGITFDTIYVRLTANADPSDLPKLGLTYSFHWTKNGTDFKRFGFSDLPDNDLDNSFNKKGKVFKLKHDEPGFPAGYYGALHTDDPPWTRLRTPVTTSEIDGETMPSRIFSEAPVGGDPRSNFVTAHQTMTPRRSGDNLTNAAPSFIGETLSDIAITGSSFFTAHNETWVKSQTVGRTNWYLDNFANVVDDDRIDFDLGGSKIALIDYLVPFQDSIVVFTKADQQFQIIASGQGKALTPATATALRSTAYSSIPNVRPVTMDFVLFFLAEKLGGTQVLEYKFEDKRATNAAEDITAHVDGYIPNGVDRIAVSSNHKMLVVHSTDEPNKLFVYKVHWIDELTKVQSAWSEWVFGDDIDIQSFEIFGDYLHFIFKRNSKLYMEKVALGEEENFSNMITPLLMDGMQLIPSSALTYSASLGTTAAVLDRIDNDVDDCVLSGAWPVNKIGRREEVVSASTVGNTTTVVIQGDVSDEAIWLGRKYESDFKPSRQYVRDQQGDGIIDGKLKLVKLLISYRDSVSFRVENRLYGRGTVTKTYSPRIVGDSTQQWGTVLVGNGPAMSVLIQTDSARADIHILNDTPYPHHITGIEWGVQFNQTTRR